MLREIAAYAKANPYANMHPIEKLLLCILPIIVMGFVQSWQLIIINIICFIGMHYMAKTPYKRVLKLVVEILLFYLISTVILVFDKGLSFALLMMLRGLSASLCLSLFIYTTPFDTLLHYFSQFESIRDLCDISKSVERFFILLEDEGNLIVLAMKSRGGFQGFKGRLHDMMKVFMLVFYNTMERWKITQEVLAARSYKGKFHYGKASYRFTRRSAIAIIGYNIILILLAVTISIW